MYFCTLIVEVLLFTSSLIIRRNMCIGHTRVLIQPIRTPGTRIPLARTRCFSHTSHSLRCKSMYMYIQGISQYKHYSLLLKSREFNRCLMLLSRCRENNHFPRVLTPVMSIGFFRSKDLPSRHLQVGLDVALRGHDNPCCQVSLSTCSFFCPPEIVG